MIQTEVVIIGGGLTGLTLARLLHQHKIDFLIMEARDRLGGRIHTLHSQGAPPLEMGATWLGRKHTTLWDLLDSLHLPVFTQRLGEFGIYEPISSSPHQVVKLPPNDEPSYRIAGGTATIIDALAASIPSSKIMLQSPVQRIKYQNSGVLVMMENQVVGSSVIISTLPPNLLFNTIDFEPELSREVIAMAKATHTWMGESIKVGFTFDAPFWREGHTSGTIFSNVGPISEMYDHSSIEDDSYAIKGFFNGAYHSADRSYRLSLALRQLSRYFGDAAERFRHYHEMVWPAEKFTYHPYSTSIYPHQNNGNPVFRQTMWKGRLVLGGSETASRFPGYMEGAVTSAQEIFDRVFI